MNRKTNFFNKNRIKSPSSLRGYVYELAFELFYIKISEQNWRLVYRFKTHCRPVLTHLAGTATNLKMNRFSLLVFSSPSTLSLICSIIQEQKFFTTAVGKRNTAFSFINENGRCDQPNIRILYTCLCSIWSQIRNYGCSTL